MSKRKHVKKIKVAPMADTNQHVREHNERVRKRNEYIAKKLAEFEAKRMIEMQKLQAARQASTSMTIDGMKKDDDNSSSI